MALNPGGVECPPEEQAQPMVTELKGKYLLKPAEKPADPEEAKIGGQNPALRKSQTKKKKNEEEREEEECHLQAIHPRSQKEVSEAEREEEMVPAAYQEEYAARAAGTRQANPAARETEKNPRTKAGTPEERRRETEAA